MSDDPDGDPLWTVRQVATRLRVCRPTVRRLLRAGTLRGVRVGTRWRVRASELDRFASEYRREAR